MDISTGMETPCPSKKHKKHKSKDREGGESEKPPGLKLILKVGTQNTPEHSTDFGYGGHYVGEHGEGSRSHHKKSKKKKKKKDKGKDREKKHKHHHKDKKRKREESEHEVEMMDTLPMRDENDSQNEELPNLGSPYREPRTCVIRKIQERTVLQKMLEHVLKNIEKKDPQQFFAWPVTDNIAPGYSAIITNPMDLSTMRQKIDDNEYKDLQDFMEDFKLMCTNAMKYNHADTIYYKASKKLLHAGLKLALPEKVGWILQFMPEVSSKELGFDILPEIRAEFKVPDKEYLSPLSKRRMPATKFEAIPDDMEPEDVLASAQKAAKEAKAKLGERKGGGPSMGFLRQNKDGTTHLNILVGGDGVIPGTKKRPVLLGQHTGKVTEGTGQLQGFREDRRNIVKPVKPLYYGAFGSYAPSYDSAFANLTKEESDLVYQTYGSDSAVQYAESILDFTRDCDYTVYMVDSLLDLLTGGEHSKTKKVLDDKRQMREEEDAVKTILETKPTDAVKVDLQELRSLSDLGIDVKFLDTMKDQIKSVEEQAELQEKLNNMSSLLDKLHKIQYQRLSQTVPAHLSALSGPSEEEVALADTITENLTDIAKRLNPSDIVPVAGVRKALGVVGPEPDAPEAQEVDLESELRQLLESENSFEEILME
ncbi:PREDICTED: bromodomain-containing protein 7 [Nicrophorus vespilloides]|uniref:Bromodomain-containing protein 7 n=1 Tax=Nicrophorus vespilloides TaxID=110193 RepID=A0ABM1N149_NICVS|nr:PREDICTED: bromodomain-containing protein 7 [Nicrophorus vespilloides]